MNVMFRLPGQHEQATIDYPPAATTALESGQIVFLPDDGFTLTDAEQCLYQAQVLDKKHKNVSYHAPKQQLGGYDSALPADLQSALKTMMRRFADFSYQRLTALMPTYQAHLRWGRTSYRPAEIAGRISSKRKDDTRVHVDAFAASPVDGWRILRVFCNINPEAKPRVWQVGEDFSTVLQRFYPQIPRYRAWQAHLLHQIKATKTLRSAYDHVMLQLHDRMKLDDQYQQKVRKQTIDFPSQSTWIVFTDSVSHAALSGQYLLEQTFYLPIYGMLCPEKSPLAQWRLLNAKTSAGSLEHT